MIVNKLLILTLSTVLSALFSSLSSAETWQCGSSKVECTGSKETCRQLRQYCDTGVSLETELQDKLTEAIIDIKNNPQQEGSLDLAPFHELNKSLGLDKCTQADIDSGKCKLVVDPPGLVQSLVGVLKYSATAFSELAKALSE